MNLKTAVIILVIAGAAVGGYMLYRRSSGGVAVRSAQLQAAAVAPQLPPRPPSIAPAAKNPVANIASGVSSAVNWWQKNGAVISKGAQDVFSFASSLFK